MMTILIEATPKVKNILADVLAEATFAEMIRFAEANYVRIKSDCPAYLSWQEFVAIYQKVWTARTGYDMTAFPVPAEPGTPDDFSAWVDQMESEFGDMADYQTAVVAGISMF